MKFWDLIKIANRNLFRNKLRTFLTVAAIFVGSFTLTMTNGLGDGVRGYVENQVKNIESESVIRVRKKVENAEGDQPDVPREYKEDTPIVDENAPIDPAAFVVTLPQIENAMRGIEGVKSITPRYMTDAEYITLDGQKKYYAQVAMLSDGITQKTEAGESITGSGQIVLPLGLARSFDQNIENLIGKTATIGYKGADGTMRTLALHIVGVATKGFQTNTSSFVDSVTARNIHAVQKREQGPDRFMGFSVQMETIDAAKIDAAKKKLGELGFEAETFADSQKRIYDGIGIFKLAMSLVAGNCLTRGLVRHHKHTCHRRSRTHKGDRPAKGSGHGPREDICDILARIGIDWFLGSFARHDCGNNCRSDHQQSPNRYLRRIIRGI